MDVVEDETLQDRFYAYHELLVEPKKTHELLSRIDRVTCSLETLFSGRKQLIYDLVHHDLPHIARLVARVGDEIDAQDDVTEDYVDELVDDLRIQCSILGSAYGF